MLLPMRAVVDTRPLRSLFVVRPMTEPVGSDNAVDADDVAEVLTAFGWEMSTEFARLYQEDAWIYNLTNALVDTAKALDACQLRYIEATNPGIDMADVQRIRRQERQATND